MSRRGQQERGQAVAEFAMAITVFVMVCMGIFDLGRGIYMYNGVAQAAREIARRTSVYPGSTLGASSQSVAVINIQKGLVPSMQDPTFTCLTITGDPSTNDPCSTGDYVKVTVTATYVPISLLGFLGNIPLTASSQAEIPG